MKSNISHKSEATKLKQRINDMLNHSLTLTQQQIDFLTSIKKSLPHGALTQKQMKALSHIINVKDICLDMMTIRAPINTTQNKTNKQTTDFKSKLLDAMSNRSQLLDTMTYEKYLQTATWRRLRKNALRRAGYKCAICGETKNLHVHHNCYPKRGMEKPHDLCVLCKRCHNLVHKMLDNKKTA